MVGVNVGIEVDDRRQQGAGGQVSWLTVDRAHDGQRIDNFLLNHLKGVPKSRIYRLLRKGEVRVNKGRVQPSRRLQCGDLIRLPPIRIAERVTVEPADRLRRLIEESVLFEDERLLVINKPAGIAVHGGSGVPHGVIEIIQAIRPDARDVALVHRLDRATSGCLLLVKERRLLADFNRLFSGRQVEKDYRALLHGRWQGGERTIDRPLRRLEGSGDHRMIVSDTGKPARTRMTPVLRLRQATLVDVRLETGRMHQIRVHAASTGAPIVGDAKYGDPAADRSLSLSPARLMLHARRLSFVPPGGRRRMTFVAPDHDDFNVLVDALKTQEDS